METIVILDKTTAKVWESPLNGSFYGSEKTKEHKPEKKGDSSTSDFFTANGLT